MSPEIAVKPHVSASQIKTYLNCGEQYRRRYIEKHIIPPGVAATRGTSVHKGAELNFRQKIKTRKDLPVKEIVDYAATVFDEQIKREGVFLSPDEEAVGQAKVVGEAKDTTVRLTELLAKEVAPAYQPLLVEEKQRIVLPKAPRDILGVLDLVDENRVIVDFKSRKKTGRQDDWDADIALTIYSMSLHARDGKPPAGIVVEELVDTKVPKRVTWRTTRTRPDYEAVVARINTVVGGVEAGVFLPANTGWWGCSPKYCGYWNSCIYTSKKK